MTSKTEEVSISSLDAEKIKRVTDSRDGFDVITESVLAVNGDSIHTRVLIKTYDSCIRNSMCWAGLRVPQGNLTMSLESITSRLPAIEAQYKMNYDEENEVWRNWYNTLSRYREEGMVEVRARIANGMIAFEDAEALFPTGTKLIIGSCPLVAGEVVRCEYRQSMFSSALRITLNTIQNTTGIPRNVENTIDLPAFPGLIKITSLPVHVASEEELKALTERGQMFRDMAKRGAAYMSCNGTVTRKGYWSNVEYKAAGRCVIDPKTMRKVDPNYFQDRYDDDDEGPQAVAGEIIPEDKLWMCSASVYGFSLTAKVWGEFKIGELAEIKFRERAFDKLVLDETRKKTIRALVENNGGSFSDIIDGKGGGCIFLLHGPPGTGKTLTAEAVAEVLKRPLYSVSVGELGTDPEKLEHSLRTILEVSTAWNAVVLLDEADIFLEARNEENILRNAMVGVFLRLLEYHQGVLFLTTNRVKNFDKAFHSRISVAIQYPDMTDEIREKVWGNLLDSAGIKDMDVRALAHNDINGRQIKNVIRLAQTLARSENRPVTMKDLGGMIKISKDFNEHLAGL